MWDILFCFFLFFFLISLLLFFFSLRTNWTEKKKKIEWQHQQQKYTIDILSGHWLCYCWICELTFDILYCQWECGLFYFLWNHCYVYTLCHGIQLSSICLLLVLPRGQLPCVFKWLTSTFIDIIQSNDTHIMINFCNLIGERHMSLSLSFFANRINFKVKSPSKI